MTRPAEDCPEIQDWMDANRRLPVWFVREFRAMARTLWCDRPPDAFPQERGIVLCADAARYGRLALRLLRRLGALGCSLPVQWWRLPEDAWDRATEDAGRALGCSFRVAFPRSKERRGWAMKAGAVAYSGFRQALFLDADLLPLSNPESWFRDGSVFWPCQLPGYPDRWEAFGLPASPRPEWDTGLFLIDQARDWPALWLAKWLNDLGDVTYRVTIGDPFTFQAAFAAVGRWPEEMPPAEARPWGLLHFDAAGAPLAEHRCWAKEEVG